MLKNHTRIILDTRSWRWLCVIRRAVLDLAKTIRLQSAGRAFGNTYLHNESNLGRILLLKLRFYHGFFCSVLPNQHPERAWSCIKGSACPELYLRLSCWSSLWCQIRQTSRRQTCHQSFVLSCLATPSLLQKSLRFFCSTSHIHRVWDLRIVRAEDQILVWWRSRGVREIMIGPQGSGLQRARVFLSGVVWETLPSHQ